MAGKRNMETVDCISYYWSKVEWLCCQYLKGFCPCSVYLQVLVSDVAFGIGSMNVKHWGFKKMTCKHWIVTVCMVLF